MTLNFDAKFHLTVAMSKDTQGFSLVRTTGVAQTVALMSEPWIEPATSWVYQYLDSATLEAAEAALLAPVSSKSPAPECGSRHVFPIADYSYVSGALRDNKVQVPAAIVAASRFWSQDGSLKEVLLLEEALALRNSPSTPASADSLLTAEDETRMPGSKHCVPLLDCPLCGSAVDIVEFPEDGPVYLAECTECKLTLGLPFGYASRRDLANDWNRRAS